MKKQRSKKLIAIFTLQLIFIGVAFGAAGYFTCASCRGSGSTVCASCHGTGRFNNKSTCAACSGTGSRRCSSCGGSGRVFKSY